MKRKTVFKRVCDCNNCKQEEKQMNSSHSFSCTCAECAGMKCDHVDIRPSECGCCVRCADCGDVWRNGN